VAPKGSPCASTRFTSGTEKTISEANPDAEADSEEDAEVKVDADADVVG